MQQLVRKLSQKKQFLLKAYGISMLPLIQADDILYIQKVKYTSLKVNDIIMFSRNNKIKVHRVIYMISKYILTKGDNNIKADGKIYPKQIIGRVYQVKRNEQIINLEDFYLFQSTLYFQEIIKVKKLLDKAKINHLFLKGLPLHLYIEESHPRKIYADCDLLINKEDYLKVEQIFIDNGNTKSDSAYSPIHRLLKDKPTEVSFFKNMNKLPIVFDIHFEPVFLMNQLGKLDALYPQKLINQMTIEFLRTKRIINIQEESFFLLDTRYLILYLTLHFFHHNFRGVFRLEMLDKIIRMELLTPELYLSLTRIIMDYRLQNIVYPVFLFLKKYFNTPLPRRFLESIIPSQEKLKYINANILNIKIFDDEPKIDAGRRRFMNIFFLSAEPLYKRILIFIVPAVIYSVIWIYWKGIISQLKRFYYQPVQ